VQKNKRDRSRERKKLEKKTDKERKTLLWERAEDAIEDLGVPSVLQEWKTLP